MITLNLDLPLLLELDPLWLDECDELDEEDDDDDDDEEEDEDDEEEGEEDDDEEDLVRLRFRFRFSRPVKRGGGKGIIISGSFSELVMNKIKFIKRH